MVSRTECSVLQLTFRSMTMGHISWKLWSEKKQKQSGWSKWNKVYAWEKISVQIKTAGRKRNLIEWIPFKLRCNHYLMIFNRCPRFLVSIKRTSPFFVSLHLCLRTTSCPTSYFNKRKRTDKDLIVIKRKDTPGKEEIPIKVLLKKYVDAMIIN